MTKQFTSKKKLTPLVLAVDDDRTMLMALESRLTKNGYRVITAINGSTACHAIEKNHQELDAILLDRMMPDMDGLEVVKWLKSRHELTQVPIIMQTGSDKPEQIKEGIDAGVFYYLTKPIEAEILKSVVASAVKESRQNRLLKEELNRHKTSFKLINECKFQLYNLHEAEELSIFLANMFPNPSYIMPGISELIVNAIEHGKCRITYDDKTKLVEHGKWRDEVIRRCNIEQLKNLLVEVVFAKSDSKYFIRITDPGQGFAWHKYLHVDPARALDNHGRGIARANMIFDQLQYNKSGNEVVASIDTNVSNDLEW